MPTVHRNLNPCRKHAGGCAWSVKATSSAPVSHADCVVAHGITAKQPSGKKFEACHAGTGNRAVFAYFKAESVEVLDCAEIRPVFPRRRQAHRQPCARGLSPIRRVLGRHALATLSPPAKPVADCR